MYDWNRRLYLNKITTSKQWEKHSKICKITKDYDHCMYNKTETDIICSVSVYVCLDIADFCPLQMQRILHMNLALAIWLEKCSKNTNCKMTSISFHKASMYEPFYINYNERVNDKKCIQHCKVGCRINIHIVYCVNLNFFI